MRLCMLGSGQRFFVDGDPSPPSNDLDMANTTFHCADQSAFTHSRGNPATRRCQWVVAMSSLNASVGVR